MPRVATAHALLIASDPGRGATLASSPAAVTLTFGEAPDPRLSTIRVLSSSGSAVSTGPVQGVAGRSDQLRITLGALPDGTYTVAWRTVSAVDGHVAAGSFAFGVGVAPSSPGPGQATTDASAENGGASAGQTVAATTARWVLYIGLVGLLGACFMAWLAGPMRPGGLRRMAAAGWVLAAVGTVGVVVIQWLEAGGDVGTLLGSSIGQAALERIVVILAAGLAVAVLVVRWPRAGRGIIGLAFLGAAAGMLVDVITGHAAAGSLPAGSVAIQWLHVVAAGWWIGGLAALIVAIRGRDPADGAALVRRFSNWAAAGLGLVIGTGVLRAIAQIGTLDALVGTDFGRIVIVKTGLLGLLAAFGAVNRFRNVGRAMRSLRPLRITGSVEVSVGLVVLLATALLVNAAPPASAGSASGSPGASPAAPAPVITTGSDFGTTVRVRLAVSPGAAGTNRLDASVTTYDGGSPAPVNSVSLRFASASRSGVASSTLALAPTNGAGGAGGPVAAGSFAASGDNLSIDGIWRVTALVSGPSGAVEVPLIVATRVESAIDVNSTPGAPTIYTVHLTGNRTVQLYLDPGRAGGNDLHATFFDAAGTELPTTTATIAAGPPGGASAILNPRLLEPGHFVVQVSPAAGKLAVDVTAPAPGGEVLHGHLEMDVAP
jgi:copper transport protein